MTTTSAATVTKQECPQHVTPPLTLCSASSRAATTTFILGARPPWPRNIKTLSHVLSVPKWVSQRQPYRYKGIIQAALYVITLIYLRTVKWGNTVNGNNTSSPQCQKSLLGMTPVLMNLSKIGDDITRKNSYIYK